MDKKVILAVAGAGKTYHICNSLDTEKKNLILSFTNENLKNIRTELRKAYGVVPEKTTVMTFDSFVCKFMLYPYEPSVLAHFSTNNFSRKGIIFDSAPKPYQDGKPNPSYIVKNDFRHYHCNGYYHGERISDLLLSCRKMKKKLTTEICKNLNLFFDFFYIDEFQDFREKDFELIMELAKYVNNITLVGDYYQHSVSADRNSGKPFGTSKNNVTYDAFIETLKKFKFKVDCETLSDSRRCPVNICTFIKNKLNIDIFSANSNSGAVRQVTSEDDILRILNDDTIMKLVYSNSKKHSFTCINWSYSKGNTYDHICVILTAKVNNINNPNFVDSSLPQILKNKLYVALTRTRGNLYLITSNDFKNVKQL